MDRAVSKVCVLLAQLLGLHAAVDSISPAGTRNGHIEWPRPVRGLLALYERHRLGSRVYWYDLTLLSYSSQQDPSYVSLFSSAIRTFTSAPVRIPFCFDNSKIASVINRLSNGVSAIVGLHLAEFSPLFILMCNDFMVIQKVVATVENGRHETSLSPSNPPPTRTVPLGRDVQV